MRRAWSTGKPRCTLTTMGGRGGIRRAQRLAAVSAQQFVFQLLSFAAFPRCRFLAFSAFHSLDGAARTIADNIQPKTGPDVCSSTRVSGNSKAFRSCEDGWCTDLS